MKPTINAWIERLIEVLECHVAWLAPAQQKPWRPPFGGFQPVRVTHSRADSLADYYQHRRCRSGPGLVPTDGRRSLFFTKGVY